MTVTPEEHLTSRQAQVLALRRQGLTFARIAAELNTTDRSVRRVVRHITKAGIEVPKVLPPQPRTQRAAVRGEITWSKWSQEKTDRLEDLWIAGVLTAEQIGDEIGVSRNAVIGKAHRLGLAQHRKHVIRPVGPRKPRPSRAKPKSENPKSGLGKPRKPRKPKEAAMCCPQFVPLTVRFADHDERKQCCWPVGEPSGHDTQYCAHGQIAGSSYCVYHHRIAYTPARPNSKVVPLRREWAA